MGVPDRYAPDRGCAIELRVCPGCGNRRTPAQYLDGLGLAKAICRECQDLGVTIRGEEPMPHGIWTGGPLPCRKGCGRMLAGPGARVKHEAACPGPAGAARPTGPTSQTGQTIPTALARRDPLPATPIPAPADGAGALTVGDAMAQIRQRMDDLATTLRVLAELGAGR